MKVLGFVCTHDKGWELIYIPICKTKASLKTQCCHFRDPYHKTCNFLHCGPVYSNYCVLDNEDIGPTSIINDVGDKELLAGYMGISIYKSRLLFR